MLENHKGRKNGMDQAEFSQGNEGGGIHHDSYGHHPFLRLDDDDYFLFYCLIWRMGWFLENGEIALPLLLEMIYDRKITGKIRI